MPTEPDSGRRRDPTAERIVSPGVMRWVVGVATMLVIWFFFAWLILDRHVLDAAGESVGTAFALGVVVSLIGALRGSR